MADRLRWGIIATGNISATFAEALRHCETGKLAAAASRRKAAAEEFAARFGAERAHGSYEGLLADDQVDAVYIATPHPMHAEWAIKAAEASKHILCEKPLAINHPQAMAIVEAAREAGVFLMEAFMYRCHPQTARLVELIRDGAIGEVRVIDAAFSFHADYSENSRLFDPALGGGGILDVGCYTASMARLVAGAALGLDFAEPLNVTGCGRIGKSGVDEWAVAALEFPGGILARLSTGISLTQDSVVKIYGSEGSIFLPSPWIVSKKGGTSTIHLSRKGTAGTEEITVETDRWLYAIEADTVAANLEKGQAGAPAMSHEDTLGNMQTLDRWRQSIGLVYPAERPEGLRTTAAGRSLTKRSDARMPYCEIQAITKKVSRLMMGVDNQKTFAHAAVMFDDFLERGGTAFDTAWVYGSGASEKLLGEWVALRGVRDDIVILDKGAHTPECYPEALTRQLMQSLERLQTDYLDIYMLHRDNPEVPVGEFVDVLNEHKSAGRIHAFGGSNWTPARIELANDYARKKGVTGFAALSNNFSLAEMIKPPWEGCISASDARTRAWLERMNLPLIAWSSQARGFFTERSAPEKTDDAELVRCWYSSANFERKKRAEALAAEKGCLPINIALAYVLCQPFPTFAIIGPRTLHETATSLGALDVRLTPGELRWLNLED